MVLVGLYLHHAVKKLLFSPISLNTKRKKIIVHFRITNVSKTEMIKANVLKSKFDIMGFEYVNHYFTSTPFT